MQPGEEIESLIDELEQVVTEAKSSFGGGGQRKIVDAQQIFDILDDIRDVFPQEFQEARRVLKEENETLDRAQKQADAIIADAQQQAMVIAGDQEVVRLEYADTVLAHLEENLKSLTGTVTRVRQTLNENSGANNNTQNVPW